MGSSSINQTGKKPVGRAEYDELVDLVRQNLRTSEVVAEQQRDIIHQLGGINSRLEQDVVDRQFELQQLEQQIDRMRVEFLQRRKASSTPSAPPVIPRPPSNIKIVGQVPTGGVVIPPIPDRHPVRQSAVPSWVVVPSPPRSSPTISTASTTTTTESGDYLRRATSRLPPYRRAY